jgi:hypothetical protein
MQMHWKWPLGSFCRACRDDEPEVAVAAWRRRR